MPGMKQAVAYSNLRICKKRSFRFMPHFIPGIVFEELIQRLN